MRADGIIRRFDDLGRIVIPRELRRQIFGARSIEGMPMEMFIEGENIILCKYEENKSDDVCERKQDNMCETVYKVCGGCFTSVYQKDYKYCPYCGKKIKIVGD